MSLEMREVPVCRTCEKAAWYTIHGECEACATKRKENTLPPEDDCAFSPLKRGDNFILGPYHFVCMGWQNGRILATRYEEHQGFIHHSLSLDVVLDPGFKIVGKG